MLKKIIVISTILLALIPIEAAQSKNFPPNITGIKYLPTEHGGEIIVDYIGSAQFFVKHNVARGFAVLNIDGKKFPAALARKINTSNVPGPVKAVVSYNRGDRAQSSKVVVRFRQEVDIEEKREPGRFRLIIKPKVSSFSAKSKRKSRVGWRKKRKRNSHAQDKLKVKSAALDRSDEVARELIQTLDTPENERVYKGVRVTLESDSVSIHDIFRLVGAASGLNIISSSAISGDLTLSIKNVPWDQLLDIVLKEQQLKATASGNVVRITTLENYIAEQQANLNLEVVEEAAEPVLLAIIPVSYADVSNIRSSIAALLVGAIDSDAGNGGAAPAGPSTGQARTAEEALQAFVRGQIETDDRTNSLLVTHTAEQIKRIRALVRELDVPTPQVMIEAKIIEAQETFAKAVGIAWGGIYRKGGVNDPDSNENPGAGFALGGAAPRR